MDRRAIYAVLVVAAAGAAYWYYTHKSASGQPPAQDQTPATAAEANYTQPPNIAAQSYSSGGQVFTQGQAQPLPYNG